MTEQREIYHFHGFCGLGGGALGFNAGRMQFGNLEAKPVCIGGFDVSPASVRLMDANSGFEPLYFDEACYIRWKDQLRGPWRFAFDIMPEWRAVERMMRILRDVSPRRKQVYVLIGNEPIASCYERAQKVIEWGGEPYCQPEMELDALEKRPKVRHDWNETLLGDFARFYNCHIWRKTPIEQYLPRKFERNPFSGMVLS
jgi:hypothetical protein